MLYTGASAPDPRIIAMLRALRYRHVAVAEGETAERPASLHAGGFEESHGQFSV